CGCLISMISFGPRATLGFFLTPMSQANDWGRDVFGLALAIQNILWGIGQPFAGAIADRFGTMRVLCAGGAFYAVGLILMAYSTSPLMLDLAAGVFIGFGLSGCTFSVVLAAFGKLLPESWRLLAFGAGTAAGSFRPFLYSPLPLAVSTSRSVPSTCRPIWSTKASPPKSAAGPSRRSGCSTSSVRCSPAGS